MQWKICADAMEDHLFKAKQRQIPVDMPFVESETLIKGFIFSLLLDLSLIWILFL